MQCLNKLSDNPCNNTNNGGCSQKCHFSGTVHKCDCFHGFQLAADNKTCEGIIC